MAVLLLRNRVWRYVKQIFEDVNPYSGVKAMYKWVCLLGAAVRSPSWITE
jgi:hypothetical protein